MKFTIVILVILVIGLSASVRYKSDANASITIGPTITAPMGTTEGSYALHVKVLKSGDGAVLKGPLINHTLTAGHTYSFKTSIFVMSLVSPLEVWFSLAPYRSSYNEVSAWFYNTTGGRSINFYAGRGEGGYNGWNQGVWYNLEIRLKDDSGGFFVNDTQVSSFSNANTLGLQIRDLYSLGTYGVGDFYADNISVMEDNSILYFEGFESGLSNVQVARFDQYATFDENADSPNVIVGTAYFGMGTGEISSITSMIPSPTTQDECVQVLDICYPSPYAYATPLGSTIELDGRVIDADSLKGIGSATVNLSMSSDPSQLFFVPIGEVKTNSSGMFRMQWTPSQMGVITLRAVYLGIGQVFSSSSMFYLGVGKAFGKLSVSLSSSTSLLGFSVQITGGLKSWYNAALADQNVLFAFTVPGATDWTTISSATTKPDGSFEIGWIPQATGTFTVRASWAGDSVHQPTSKTVSLASILQGQNVLSVSSDFSISTPSYDSNSRSLSFVLRGMRGTEGTTEVAIPKNLVPDGMRIQVLLNGTATETQSLTTNDSVRATFSVVMYSSYNVKVNVAVNTEPPTGLAGFSMPLSMPLLLGVIATVGFASTIAYARLRKDRGKRSM